MVALQTTLDDGQHFTTVLLALDESMLGGAHAFEVELVWFDEGSGDWALAVAGNTAASPGHAGLIGDRVTVLGPGPWGNTQDLGDWGVYWDPTLEQGFAWANVDHAGDFAAGLTLCVGDCGPAGGDGVVDVQDLVAMITGWQSGAGSACDLTSDGVIDASDHFALLDAWGLCP
jgi:hypothetical protein